LKAKATALGLPTLPGSGSLTLATRYVEGGRATVLSYIQLAAMNGNDSALTFWHVYADLTPSDQAIVSLDDLCAASGIAPKAILMAIAASGFDAGCDIANLVAAHLHPKVVQASVDAALTPEGIEDRKLLLQHAGFIPVPKGQSIVINASSHATAQAHASSAAAAGMPSFLSDVEDVTEATKAVQGEIVEAQKALHPAPTSEPWTETLDTLKSKEKVG
jgi:hypothetical protein